MQIQSNKNLIKRVFFTITYYNVLGYYPTSFFIWKNLIDIKGLGKGYSFSSVVEAIDDLTEENKIVAQNGIYRIVERHSTSPAKSQKKILAVEKDDWYKQQIQKNKISADKIKRARNWARASRWVPYLRGLFLTGTLAMKRGGSNSDWDVLVVLKKNRIWLGRLIFTVWLQVVGKRRRGQMIENRFCLNQFVVDKKLKFKERNEFFSNELLTAENLIGDTKLKNKIMEKNKKWIKRFKPNFKFRKIESGSDGHRFFFSKIVQRKLEVILEVFNLAEMANVISKKIMIHKIINNPKTYSPGADIRYSDFFLVFLPKPQREKVKQKAIRLLNSL